jgi:hypothetical protein
MAARKATTSKTEHIPSTETTSVCVCHRELSLEGAGKSGLIDRIGITAISLIMS